MSNQLSQCSALEKHYRRFLINENSADFIHEISQRYTLHSLGHLVSKGKRVTRRAATLAVGFLGSFKQNHVMGQALIDQDRGVRLLADHSIRQLWFRVGNPSIEFGLRRIFRENRRHHFVTAIDLCDDLIELDPTVAEVWNQRAIACYNLEDYCQAISDCCQCIELNPFHFLAALGSANCNLERGDVVEALADYRLALAINPDLESVRRQIDQLSRIVEGR